MKKVDVPQIQWESIGVQSPQRITGFKGENTLDPFSIQKVYATRTKNLTGAGYPTLQVRPGISQVGNNFGGRITGIGVHKDTTLHAIGAGNWAKWNGSTWQNILSGLSTTAPATFCNFQGNFSSMNILMANGVDPVRKYDGVNISGLSGAPNGANFICQHDGRVYAAVNSKVHFTALRKAEDWSTVDEAGEITVETNNGENITGLAAGSRHLMVFKDSSFHELWGTNPENFSMDLVASDIGLLSNQALVDVQGTPFWLDKSAAYYYNGGRPRRDFCLPVRGYIEGMNSAQRAKASAGTDGNRVYFSIPSAYSSEPDTILEYDPEFQVWYTWKDFVPLCFANMNGASWYAGDLFGNVLQIGGTATTDRGIPISYEWVSAPFGGGSQAQRLQWYRMWYVADVPPGSTMNVYLSPSAEGDSDWTMVKTVSGGELQSGRIIVPVETVANANWVRVRFAGTGPIRITEFDYQQRELPMY